MGQERIIHAALLGAGTVGSGVYKLVKDLEEEIISKTGARLVVDKILVRDTTKAREGIPSELLIDRWDEILNDPKIEIVIEVMGGIRPALTWLEEALRAGKQVVTANKDLLAEYGEQLFDAAEAGKCDLHFEAAVAGAIPIIRPLRQSLAASELTEVMGIVNGTTNYILTRMTEDGMGYEEALALATKLGYAESDPTADVEGYDAGRKVAIMASIAFNSNVTFSQVYTEGITHITAEDIRYAKEFGYVIKLIGNGGCQGGNEHCPGRLGPIGRQHGEYCDCGEQRRYTRRPCGGKAEFVRRGQGEAQQRAAYVQRHKRRAVQLPQRPPQHGGDGKLQHKRRRAAERAERIAAQRQLRAGYGQRRRVPLKAVCVIVKPHWCERGEKYRRCGEGMEPRGPSRARRQPGGEGS